MLCIAETVLPVVGFATGLPVVSRAPLLRTCPGFSEQFCSYLQRRIMVLEYLLYSSAANLLGSSYVSTPSVPPEFIAEVRATAGVEFPFAALRVLRAPGWMIED